MTIHPFDPDPDHKAELSLRVSVATLVRLVYANPPDGQVILVLERTATLIKNSTIVVRVKPFGGGVRILNSPELENRIGQFQYDSRRSEEENDFRIRILPTQWEAVKQVCREHLKIKNGGLMENGPARELSEELYDSLQIQILPEDYSLSSPEMLTEDRATFTENIYAPGMPTKRIYYLYEAMLGNPEVIEMIIENSQRYSDVDLERMALENARAGGKGRANAVFTLPLADITEFYRSVPDENRNSHLNHDGHQLDGNIRHILDLRVV